MSEVQLAGCLSARVTIEQAECRPELDGVALSELGSCVSGVVYLVCRVSRVGVGGRRSEVGGRVADRGQSHVSRY